MERSGASSPDGEIRFLGDLHRIEVKPGDRFVLSVDEYLSTDTAKRVKQQMEAALGGAPVIVLGKGMTIGVLSAAAA